MLNSASAFYIRRDIFAGGKLIFKEGEIVTVERISQHDQRPEYKYVVFSARAGKYYLLSDRDISQCADKPSGDLKGKARDISSKGRGAQQPTRSDSSLEEKKPNDIFRSAESQSARTIPATDAPATPETITSTPGTAKSPGERMPLAGSIYSRKYRGKMNRRNKILLAVFFGIVLLVVFDIFFMNENEKTTIEEIETGQTQISESETQPGTTESASSFEKLISIENLIEGQQVTAGIYTVSGRFLLASSLKINNVPVGVVPGTNEFHHPVTINEGENTLLFVAADKEGEEFSKEVKVTGILPPEQYKASCPLGPPYNVLSKNPDNYKGMRCQYKGKVAQAMESMGMTTLRVDITHKGYGIWDDTIYVTLGGSTPAVEDSIVVVYGTIAGSYTYESIAGWNITLPWVIAKYVDVVS